MKTLTAYISETLADSLGNYGIPADSPFEVAASAFYIAAVLNSTNRASEWPEFFKFIRAHGFGRQLTRYDGYDRSGRLRDVSDGPGLVMFRDKSAEYDSVQDVVDDMFRFTWYWVPDMTKWSFGTDPDSAYACFGKGRYVRSGGVISKDTHTSSFTFRWSSREGLWKYVGKSTKSKDVFLWYDSYKGIDYVPVVVPYDDVVEASRDEKFVEEFLAAFESDFNRIASETEAYNACQDELRDKFEKNNLYKSLWSSGTSIMKDLDKLSGGHAKEIFDYIKRKQGSWASLFGVVGPLQDEIVDLFRDDIPDELLLRAWMSMSGDRSADYYFRKKKYWRAHRESPVGG